MLQNLLATPLFELAAIALEISVTCRTAQLKKSIDEKRTVFAAPDAKLDYQFEESLSTKFDSDWNDKEEFIYLASLA